MQFNMPTPQHDHLQVLPHPQGGWRLWTVYTDEPDSTGYIERLPLDECEPTRPYASLSDARRVAEDLIEGHCYIYSLPYPLPRSVTAAR